MTATSTEPTHLFVAAPDGLALHVASYGERTSAALPVVCLPGLARTAGDFDELARALAGRPDEPRRVLALDYRGRGDSAYDRPENYTPAVELGDLLAVLTALEVPRAIFVGTSRGGLIAMLLAAARPGAIAGVVLNDVGPVVEPKGLLRIKGYVGTLPQPRSFAEGAEILQRLGTARFPKLTEADWLRQARLTWREADGGFRLAYDPRLARTLDGVDLEQPLPSLWPQFDALGAVPVMVVHGANSDILVPATVEAMRARHPDLDVLEVPDQGHAPLLAEPPVIGRIASFVGFCEFTRRA
ncbi:MAG: alpha/beta hydrolase [Bradyrhizobiaceae bacterium]|nr:MAG: alpha/beta hydrolase [Bradyrhizobiaceae bacterium]